MSKGAVLNQKQEVDLTGYLQQSDVVNTVTQGNQSPVSSGAVYDYVQNSVGDLPWKLLNSKEITYGNYRYSVNISQPIEFLKFVITGTCSTQSSTRIHLSILFANNDGPTFKTFYKSGGTVEVNSILATSVWTDYDANDELLLGFNGIALVKNNVMPVYISCSNSDATEVNLVCNIYYI